MKLAFRSSHFVMFSETQNTYFCRYVRGALKKKIKTKEELQFIFYNCMLKLMKHVRYNFHGATMSFLKTHNTLNPFINRSTSNDGWKFSPQAALSPICTMTEESKSIDPSTKKGKEKKIKIKNKGSQAFTILSCSPNTYTVFQDKSLRRVA